MDEALVLEELFGHNYQQLITGAKKQLDVILVNNTDPILNVSVDNYVKKLFKFDHQPFQLKLSLNDWFKVTKTLPVKEDFSLFLFEKANWNEIGLYIVQNPFKPFCFSNVDVVVDLWYDWLHKILEEHISKKTKHRMSLPPWVSNKTSNAIKRRNTMRKWMNKKPSPNNYLKLATLESRVSEFLNENQKEFEHLVFENGTFSQIQKFFKSIQKSSQLPSEMYLNDQIAVTDKEKVQLFKEFFQPVLTNSDYQRTSDNSKPSNVDKLTFKREEVQTTLENLCIGKAKGPDGLGNLPLKSLADTRLQNNW